VACGARKRKRKRRDEEKEGRYRWVSTDWWEQQLE
jgi:hypothetical protein